MKKKNLLMTILVLVMALLFVGCNDKEDEIPFYSTDEDVFAIETPYGDLYYPEKWKDKAIIKDETLENGYAVSFYTSFEEEVQDDNQILLFDVVFGEAANQPIGVLTVDEEKVNVSIVNHVENLDDFSDEERMTVGGMIEDSNVILSKLLEQYDFELVM